MRKKIFAIFLAVVMAFSATTAIAASSEGINTIKLDKNYLSLTVGNVYNFEVWKEPSRINNKAYKWYTSNSNIVRLSDSAAYAVGVGRATVTVTTDDGSVRDQCIIDVSYTANSNSGSINPISGVPNYYPGNPYYPNYPYYPYYGYNNPYYSGPYYPDGPYYQPPANSASDLPTIQQPVKSFIIPGKATDAVELSIELRQSTLTSLDGKTVNYHFSRSSDAMSIAPQVVDYGKVNGVSFQGNILNRLGKFGYKTIDYVVGDQVRVSLTSDMNNQIQNTISVQKIVPSAIMATAWSSYGDSVLSGPWRISTNVDNDGIKLRFYLPHGFDMTKAEMDLVKWNESSGQFDVVSKDAWSLKRYTKKEESGKFVETSDSMTQGVYALVPKN